MRSTLSIGGTLLGCLLTVSAAVPLDKAVGSHRIGLKRDISDCDPGAACRATWSYETGFIFSCTAVSCAAPKVCALQQTAPPGTKFCSCDGELANGCQGRMNSEETGGICVNLGCDPHHCVMVIEDGVHCCTCDLL